MGTLHLRLAHVLDDVAQLLPHVLSLLGILHTLAGDELMHLSDVVNDAVADGLELLTVGRRDGVEVVIHVLEADLRRALESVDHLQAGIGPEVEPHVALQYILVGGHTAQPDGLLAAHGLEGTLVVL